MVGEETSGTRAKTLEAPAQRLPPPGPAKPRLRGWIHAVAAPVVLAAGVAPTAPATVAAGVFSAAGVILFTLSAVYHRGTWSPRTQAILRRTDHADILLLIAGTYTPFAVLGLHGVPRVALLCVIWGGAGLGVAFRLAWIGAPRWAYVPVYLGLGWSAAFFLPQLARGAGPAALGLAAAGGVLYTLGGIVYALKRPDPSPRVFGFHEVFHAFTVAAFACQYIAVSLLVYRA